MLPDCESKWRAESIKLTIRLLRQHYGDVSAEQFGPRALRALQAVMQTEDREHERTAWSTQTTNARCRLRVSREQLAEVLKWRRKHRWNSYQLRHNYATEVRRQYGLEAAQILLGHSSAVITDAVYAERDMTKAVAIAAVIG